MLDIIECAMPTDPRFTDLTGRDFGTAVVLRLAGRRGRKIVWDCECECGGVFVAQASNLASLTARCADCIANNRREQFLTIQSRSGNKTHGLTRTPEHGVWTAMLRRCRNLNCAEYASYGGRGITICERWLQFANFMSDMGPRPTSRHTIERVDNSRGYDPDNCVWATFIEQARNRRNNLIVEAFGRSQCLAAWAEESAIQYHTIKARLRHGWPAEKALTHPVRRRATCPKN